MREILVVLDGVTCRDAGLQRRDAVRYVELAKCGAARARNAGAYLATGTHLVFLDDDIVLGRDWPAAMTAALSAGVQCLTGPVLPMDSTVLSRARDLRYKRRYRGLRCGDAVPFLAGGNTMIARDLFVRMGGFELLPTGSDNALARRLLLAAAGGSFCWGLNVLHRNDRGLWTAVRASWRAGQTEARVGQMLERPVYASLRDVRQLAPSFLNGVLWGCKAVSRTLERLRHAAPTR